MKKLLALVLALVMTLGLATISSNAAFKDENAITYKEAVQVMNAIGVLQGDDAGAFNPTQPLTREQGAKIIAYMLLGKTAADALNVGFAPFEDVPADRWSAGVIAYCKNAGILAGVNAQQTLFNPTGTLDGAAFSKMLLTALGYDATKEGLTGSSYMLNAIRLVNKIDLAKDLGSMSYTGAITRDVAAKLAFNTLTKTMVEYPGAFTVKTSDGTVVDSATTATGVANTAYDYRSDGVAALAGVATTMQFCENYFPNLKVEKTVDDFGVAVNKWFMGNNRTDYLRDDDKSIVSEDGDELLATFTTATTPKKIRAAIGTTAADQLTLVTTAATFTGTNKLIVYIDGVPQANNPGQTGALAKANYVGTSTDDIPTTGKGVITRVYRDSDTGNVTIAINGVYLARALSNYNTKDSKLAVVVYAKKNGYNAVPGTPGNEVMKVADWPTEIKTEDIKGLENYKKDDLMLITATNPNTAAGTPKWTIRSVEALPAANKISGTVTAFRDGGGLFLVDDNGTVTTGGKTYSYSRSTNLNIGLINSYTINSGTYEFYLDESGYVVGMKEVEGGAKAEDYLFVTGHQVTPGFEAKAKVTFMDGTKATINVSKLIEGGAYYTIEGTGAAAGQIALGAANWAARTAGDLTIDSFYKFEKKNNGEYELTALTHNPDDTATQATAGNYNTGKVTGYSKSGEVKPVWTTANNNLGFYANSKTVTVANGKVYNGNSNMPKVGDNTAGNNNKVFYYVNDEHNNLIALYTATSGSSSADTTKYAYVWADRTKSKNGDDVYYVYNAIVDGELTTINSEDIVAAGLYDITTTKSGGYVELAGNNVAAATGLVSDYQTNVTQTGSALFEIDKGTLIVNGSAVAAVTDSTRYFSINATKATANVEEIGDGSVLTLDNTKTYTYVCFKANDSAKTVNMIYFIRTV